MFLQRVVNVFGGFERFMEHAFAFLSLNVPAESCERFWWFCTFYGACIRFSVAQVKCSYCRIHFLYTKLMQFGDLRMFIFFLQLLV